MAILIAALAVGEARAMIPALTLPADRVLPWTYGAHPRPLRYRALFVDGIAEMRPICLDPRRGQDRNGACAAFVAAAARIGDFESAWQAMLGGYDRREDAHRDGTFPQRLRAFLVAHGYLPA